MKIGDLCTVEWKIKSSDPLRFIGYEPCKWMGDDRYDVNTGFAWNSCHDCKGKVALQDGETEQIIVLCSTITIRFTNYSKLRIIHPVLPEELFEI